jgi:hypothetical protein
MYERVLYGQVIPRIQLSNRSTTHFQLFIQLNENAPITLVNDPFNLHLFELPPFNLCPCTDLGNGT